MPSSKSRITISNPCGTLGFARLGCGRDMMELFGLPETWEYSGSTSLSTRVPSSSSLVHCGGLVDLDHHDIGRSLKWRQDEFRRSRNVAVIQCSRYRMT